MQKRISLICFAAVMLTFGVCNNVNAQVFTYVFGLSGAQEVPIGSGDPDGFGTATLMIDSATNTVDWDFVVSGIDLPLTGAHIHQAPAGTNGGIIVNFGGALTGSGLTDADLAAVVADPTNHYVNLHNSAFPGGAIRGQITAAVPEPSSASLLALAASACWMRRKRS